MDDQEKQNAMKAVQLEALDIIRRDKLSTTDFKENRDAYVSVMKLEPRRLVNQSSIGEGERVKLEGWNSETVEALITARANQSRCLDAFTR